MRILIVEDQTLVRGAISSLLDMEMAIEVVAQANNGEEAWQILQRQRDIDLVLTDIEMPVMSGLELAANIVESKFEMNIVIMTTFSKSGYIKRALALGVKAFVLKEAPIEYLVDCLTRVEKGERIVDPELALMALDDKDPLTEKERKALKLASEGIKTSDIAKRLYLSEGTVRNYLSEAIAKLNAMNRVDAARIAMQKGWI